MAGIKPNVYAVIVTSVGFLCLVISATAVGVPVWAYYEGRGIGQSKRERRRVVYGTNALLCLLFSSRLSAEDRGYFGPWQKCQVLSYRERCGDIGRFKPDGKNERPP